ncbi:unnamed protein product [Protopolystoma xenopodis]|uniref:Uncharacterized protein n=1 Tax=Protopolystoma xenopodis TaxID=117903 RepID=A0A448XNK5_9PLAT|nr:unnamed protein product [Protopolystoma xenopodis]
MLSHRPSLPTAWPSLSLPLLSAATNPPARLVVARCLRRQPTTRVYPPTAAQTGRQTDRAGQSGHGQKKTSLAQSSSLCGRQQTDIHTDTHTCTHKHRNRHIHTPNWAKSPHPPGHYVRLGRYAKRDEILHSFLSSLLASGTVGPVSNRQLWCRRQLELSPSNEQLAEARLHETSNLEPRDRISRRSRSQPIGPLLIEPLTSGDRTPNTGFNHKPSCPPPDNHTCAVAELNCNLGLSYGI